MSILKRHVKTSSNFVSFFIVKTHISSVSFNLIHFLLWIKGSLKSPNFETYECSGENLPNSLCHFPNHKSVFLQIFLSLLSVMKDNSSVLYLAQTFYYLVKRSPLKCTIVGTFESSGKNLSNSSCQFRNDKSISLQILYLSSVL